MALNHLVCFENRDRDLVVQLQLEGDTLTTRFGPAGRPCVTVHDQGNADALQRHLDEVAARLRLYGYTECADPPQMTEGSMADVIWTNEIPADAKFDDMYNDVARIMGSGRAWPIAHFKDGLSYEGDFNFGTLGLVGVAIGGVIVEGAVTINGVLFITGDEGPVSVRIYGDVTAQSLINTNTITRISGDLQVAQTVLGASNDGELSIFGTVRAEAVVAADQVIYANDYDSFRYDMIHSADMAWIDPDVIYHEDGIPEFPDRDAIWGRISKGESILAEGVRR